MFKCMPSTTIAVPGTSPSGQCNVSPVQSINASAFHHEAALWWLLGTSAC